MTTAEELAKQIDRIVAGQGYGQWMCNTEWFACIAAKLREQEREIREYRARMEDLRVIGVFMAGDAPPFVSAVFGQISGHYFEAIEEELKNQDVKVEGDALVYVEYEIDGDREELWLKEISRRVVSDPIETPEES